MIIGKSLEELKRYIGLNKNLDMAINYILKNDLLLSEAGKYVVDEGVSLIREDYEPRDIEKCYFEGHEKYLDIQIVLKGKEGFGYCDINNDNLRVTEEYNEDKDIKKYLGKPEFIFEMTEGSFAIVFPEDLHMPKIKLIDSYNVKKAVFKVKL